MSLGSVFKPFTFAVLNEEFNKPETEFLDLPKSIQCGNNELENMIIKFH